MAFSSVEGLQVATSSGSRRFDDDCMPPCHEIWGLWEGLGLVGMGWGEVLSPRSDRARDGMITIQYNTVCLTCMVALSARSTQKQLNGT